MGNICNNICYYLCCGCCCEKYEKSGVKKKKDFSQIDALTKTPPEAWKGTKNPLEVKTAQMSDTYRIPHRKY